MNFPAEPAQALADHDLAAMAAALMQSRQTILPKRLTAPGPDAAQLELILSVAASAPDHGQLLPWRFVIVPQAARAALAEVFGAALVERDAAATPEQRKAIDTQIQAAVVEQKAVQVEIDGRQCMPVPVPLTFLAEWKTAGMEVKP